MSSPSHEWHLWLDHPKLVDPPLTRRDTRSPRPEAGTSPLSQFWIPLAWFFGAVGVVSVGLGNLMGLVLLSQRSGLWVNLLGYGLAIALIGSQWQRLANGARVFAEGAELIAVRVLGLFIGVFDALLPKGARRFLPALMLLIITSTIAVLLGWIVPTWRQLVDGAYFLQAALTQGQWSSLPDYLWISARVLLSVLLLALLLRAVFARRWRSMLDRPTLQTRSTVDAPEAQRRIKLAHLSDLHLPRESVPLTENGRKLAPEAWSGLMRSLSVAASGLDAVVVTGDITDAGAAASWQDFLREMPPAMRERLILLPGNHDLNIVAWAPRRRGLGWAKLSALWWAEARGAPGLQRRSLRALTAMGLTMGDRAYVLCPIRGRPILLREYLDVIEASANAWLTNPEACPKDRQPQQLLAQAFPLAVPVRDASVVTQAWALVWNSVKPAMGSMWNAVGSIERDQTRRAERLLASESLGMNHVFHLMHHHLALPERQRGFKQFWRNPGRAVQGAGMVIDNVASFTDWLAARGVGTVVLHGHHHKGFNGVIDNTAIGIVSACSSTLGCEWAQRGTPKASGAHWTEVELACADQAVWVEKLTQIPV